MMKRIFPLLVITITGFILVLPFFHKGYFPTHDGEWAVVRLSDMYREIKDGQIPARFSGNLNFGYGYPLFNFAYPLPYYLGLPFFLLHIGLVNSIKILFILSVPLSGVGMYYLARNLWKNEWSGFISALLYMYLPYRMVDLYVRGSLGESIASVFFPVILLLMRRLAVKQSVTSIAFLAVSIAALIMTHNIMAVLFGIIAGVYFVYLLLTYKSVDVLQIVFGVVGGLLLSSFFWLPALGEKHFILLSQIPIADRNLYFVSIPQLLYGTFGYGTPTEANPFTYQIGFAQIIVFIIAVSVVLVSVFKKGRKEINRELLLFASLALVFILMMFSLSKPVWMLPLLKEINYPWTALLPLGFLLSVIAGGIVPKIKWQQYLLVALVAVNCLVVLTYAHPQEYVDRGDGFYFTNDATTTSSHELMPLTVKSLPTSRAQQKVDVINGAGSATIQIDKSQLKIFSVNLQKDAIVRLNTIYYPGWNWYKDGKKIAISYDNPQGVMQSQLPKGSYTITASFEDTSLRKAANLISLFSLLGLGIGVILSHIKHYSLSQIIKK